MKKVIRLTESDLVRIVKRVINEQTTPPSDAKLNLFCKNNKINDSFKESDLTYSSEEDLVNGVKRLSLNRGVASSLDKTFGNADLEGGFRLDLTPVNLLGDRYKNEINSDNNSIQLITFNGNRQGVPYFCSIDNGTDSKWVSYFNKF